MCLKCVGSIAIEQSSSFQTAEHNTSIIYRLKLPTEAEQLKIEADMQIGTSTLDEILWIFGPY